MMKWSHLWSQMMVFLNDGLLYHTVYQPSSCAHLEWKSPKISGQLVVKKKSDAYFKVQDSRNKPRLF